MRHLELLLGLQQLLADGEPREPREALVNERLARIISALLALGVELHKDLPDPAAFVCGAADTLSDLAELICPRARTTGKAIRYLGKLQRKRLPRREEPPLGEPSEVHLGRAFWSLSGLVAELAAGGEAPRRLEELAAELANHVLFTVSSSGAWDRSCTLGGGSPPESPTTPAAAPEPAPSPPDL